MDSKRELQVTLLAEPKAIKHIRDTIGSFCRAVAIEEQEIDDIKLILSEACTNVVRHAYDHRLGVVKVKLEVDGQKIYFWVRDEGKGLGNNTLQAKFWSRQRDLKPGGLGIHIMTALVDEVRFYPLDTGTEVELVRHFH